MNSFGLDQLANDLARSAALVGAPFDAAMTRHVIGAYAEQFSNAAVEMRTTNKPDGERELSYRYVALQSSVNPLPIAMENGLLKKRGSPLERLLPALCARYEVSGWGVDAGATFGLEKLWPFLKFGYPVESAFNVPHLPESIESHRDYYARHNLRHFSILAVDHRHETVNLYFMIKEPRLYDADALGRMIGDLGFAAPQRSVLEYNTNCVAINLTFAYASKDIERICFYVPAPDASLVPTREYPLFARFVHEVPMAADRRMFVLGHTFTRRASYVKLEMDYSGTTLGCLQACVGVPLAR